MLKELREKNSQIFMQHFKEVFGDRFDVGALGNFPKTILQISTKDPQNKTTGILEIDVVEETFILQMESYKIEGEGDEEKRTPTLGTIDKTTLDFILERSIMLSKTLFGFDNAQEAPESPEKEPNDSPQ